MTGFIDRLDSAGWSSVEFVSDLHLCAEAPRTFCAFEQWLSNSRADAIVILGDLFEVWIGDDTRTEPFHRACLAALAAAAARRPVYFMHGNRDFLLGRDAMSAGGLTPLQDPCRLDAFGQRLLLSHGDALCLSDQRYLAFRAMVRDQVWQKDFLARPLNERAAIAKRIRSESQGRKAMMSDLAQWPDVDGPEACAWLKQTAARTLVHGHTHKPGLVELGSGLQRRVLTDWDFDGEAPRGLALALDAQGWHERELPPLP